MAVGAASPSEALGSAACPACGTRLRATARFCDECGRPLARSAAGPQAAEYKQVTVLFADVVHSMELAAAVGAERLREIMVDLLDRATAVVEHYGGTVDKFTGDGIMAVFGAPAALEDHAVRACRAALAIQAIDWLRVQLRVGLNSGRVIVGDIGSGPWGYTAIGEAVGMAQRMESVAPTGSVLLSESTARLVEHVAVMAPPELVRIKGFTDPVPARRLLSMVPAHRGTEMEVSLIGRESELHALSEAVGAAANGVGTVVAMVGDPGIGKSRLVREIAADTHRRGIAVIGALCEAHTVDVPFHLVASLLRGISGSAGVRERLPDADAEDLALLDDLLGVAGPTAAPKIDPDARRRRLTALINAASLARTTPALYIIEDVHWIDAVSESLIIDFLTVIPQTPTAVLLTYRPEYQGPLSTVAGLRTLPLAPLSSSDIAELVQTLLGGDPSVIPAARLITERADGNPFFAAEMVRDLAERGVLGGARGRHTCTVDLADVDVPATLQATISARIDRLNARAKRTLNAAAVIGSRFDTALLNELGVEPALDDLVGAELVDRRGAEFAFHHPLIRTVAYESQLKADRIDLHGRVARALQACDAVDENAALIAEHLAAADAVKPAFGWHMRAAMWSNTRDVGAAQRSWERARELADRVPHDDPDCLMMRTAPRTLLCATSFRRSVAEAEARFAELSELCSAAGDKVSLAIGMTGPIAGAMGSGRVPEANRLAVEQLALVDAIDDPDLTISLFSFAAYVLVETGNWTEALRWSESVIVQAGGDASRGALLTGCPLALAHAVRGTARWALGLPAWRDDFDQAITMSRATDPLAHAQVIAYTTGFAVGANVRRADDAAVRDATYAVQVVQDRGDNIALGVSWYSLGVVLAQRSGPQDGGRGAELLAHVRRWCEDGRYYRSELPVLDAWVAWLHGMAGDLDDTVVVLRSTVDALIDKGQFGYTPAGVQHLTDALLRRAGPGDLAEAEAVLRRYLELPVDLRIPFYRIVELHIRAALARAQDHPQRRQLAAAYRDLAKQHDYAGHLDIAEAMLA